MLIAGLVSIVVGIVVGFFAAGGSPAESKRRPRPMEWTGPWWALSWWKQRDGVPGARLLPPATRRARPLR